MATQTTTSAATPGQVSYVRDLLTKRDWDNHPQVGHLQRGQALLKAGHLTRDAASWIINQLRTAPYREGAPATPRAPKVEIPDGRYMVGGQRYRLVTSTEGKWAGFQSVRALDGHLDETFLKGDARRQALALIGADPRAAAMEYGRRTGRCGYCHRDLTDSVSVASGVGPICRDKYGIPAVKPGD